MLLDAVASAESTPEADHCIEELEESKRDAEALEGHDSGLKGGATVF